MAQKEAHWNSKDRANTCSKMDPGKGSETNAQKWNKIDTQTTQKHGTNKQRHEDKSESSETEQEEK